MLDRRTKDDVRVKAQACSEDWRSSNEIGTASEERKFSIAALLSVMTSLCYVFDVVS